MPKSIYESKKESEYRSYFSPIKYKFFLFIEKLYKRTVNNTDNRIPIIIDYLKQKKPIKILEIGSGTLPIYKFIPKEQKNK